MSAKKKTLAEKQRAMRGRQRPRKGRPVKLPFPSEMPWEGVRMARAKMKAYFYLRLGRSNEYVARVLSRELGRDISADRVRMWVWAGCPLRAMEECGQIPTPPIAYSDN